MHDVQAQTSNRIAWAETLNMHTDCPHKAWKVMTYTARVQNQLKAAAGLKNTGRKLAKPVMHLSLSWHPEERPDKDEMLCAASLAIEKIGMKEHEAIIVAHNDTAHSHIHILMNRCHPETGAVAKDSHTKRKLSRFAQDYEMNRGKVYCERNIREPNQKNLSVKDTFKQLAAKQEEQILAITAKFNAQIKAENEAFHSSQEMRRTKARIRKTKAEMQKQGWISKLFGLKARKLRQIKRLTANYEEMAARHYGKINALKATRDRAVILTIKEEGRAPP